MKMSSNMAGFVRPGLLSPAERLSPGTCAQGASADWLKCTPMRPAHFLPMLEMTVKHRLIPVLVRNIPPPCGILGLSRRL